MPAVLAARADLESVSDRFLRQGDATLLLRLDKRARCEDFVRSAWIREVIADALWERDLAELNKQDREAYAAMPQTDEEITEWLEVQAWDEDEWESAEEGRAEANGRGRRP